MRVGLVSKLGWRLAASGLLMATLLIYVPLSLRGMVGIVVVGAGFLFVEHRNALLLAASLFMITLLMEGGIRLFGEAALTPYYRPHEILALEGRHRSSERIEMRMPHGDLLAIDPGIDRGIAVRREVRFYTDELGFRNEQAFSGERLVVVGDSFVAGDGGSQEDTISSKLQVEQQMPSYNLGFQAGPYGYAERITWARSYFPPETCLVLLMFEGNDFQLVDTYELNARRAVPVRLQSVVKSSVRFIRDRFVLSKVFYGLITRAQEMTRRRITGATAGATPPARTFVGSVQGQSMGFLSGYADVTRRATFEDGGFIRSMLTKAPPDMIFFVPDKYRVYGPLLIENKAIDLPDAQWQHLKDVAEQLQIEAIDLTQALRSKSAELLERGEFTYWRDDTHWNGNGTSIAAQEIARAMEQSAVSRCRAARKRSTA